MRLVRPLIASVAALAAGALLAATPAQAASAKGASVDKTDHCTATGGVASTMYAWANTNADADQWMQYGGKVAACTYTAADSSQITIWSKTLDSKLPTMAALAYYAEVAYTGSGGNPADGYCIQLGGSWQIGDGVSGGGWATDRGQNVYGMCSFADGSSIDGWGLLYHAYNIVRGQDLSTVLRFKNPY
jgi:putative hemolysin